MQLQTEPTVEVTEQYEYCVSRVDPQNFCPEESSPNEAPMTMCGSQLEASRELIVASVVETTDRAIATEAEEITPLYQ